MSSTTIGKIAAGIAGATGTSSLGISAFAVFRVTSAHAVPGMMWASLVALGTATVLVSCLGLALEYRLKKLGVEERSKEAQSAAELQKVRLEIHRTVMEKAAGEPGSAQSYRELIIADALHLSVEQSGARLAGRTHEHLYGPALSGLARLVDAREPGALTPRDTLAGPGAGPGCPESMSQTSLLPGTT